VGPAAGRKASGESSIYQDAGGRWHGYVSMGLKTGGVRDRRHVSGAKRADVVKKVRDLERHRDAGTVTAAGQNVTVRQWLEHWLDNVAARKVRPSTLTRYRGIVLHQIIPELGHHRLDKLQPEHVDAFYVRLIEHDKLAPATVLQVHRVLSRALKVAVQRGRAGRNAASLVDPPSVARREIQPLTADEARRLLSVAADERNGARWTVALALGLRQGEALGLTWSDVDLDAEVPILTVRRALQRQAGKGLVLVQPKSRAGGRAVVLPAPLVEALRAHRRVQLQERLLAGELWQETDLVFAQPNGRPLDPRGDNRAWHRLLASADVRRARLHDARHTAASLLLLQRVPARVVMEMLGHSQVSLTLNTYSHVAPELARDAAERMTDVLWG
jgi:integrase